MKTTSQSSSSVVSEPKWGLLLLQTCVFLEGWVWVWEGWDGREEVMGDEEGGRCEGGEWKWWK